MTFLALTACLGIGKAYAVAIELPIGNNNTVYFSITDATNHYVEYVCPNESNVSWDGYDKPTGILDLPGTFEYMGVNYTATSIGNAAFYGCSGLYAVIIPSTITSINIYAFRATNLIQVTINSNAIASAQYSSYHSLSTLFGNTVQGYSFGPGVTTIGPCALYGCLFVESVTISNTVTSIGYEAFENCSGLESVTIPNSVITIGRGVFSGCSSLTEVTMGSGLTFVAQDAFRNCSSLTRVNVTDLAAWCAIEFDPWDANPLYFAHHLYVNNSLVTNLNIPSGVTSIGSYVFSGGTDLISVTFPNTISSVGSDAFDGCSNLSRVNISNLASWCQISFADEAANPLYYAHHLYLNNSLVTNLNVPSGVTSIGSYVFSGGTDLTSVTIPNSVASIGSRAFRGCTGLTRVNTSGLAAWCQIGFVDEEANPLSYAHHLYNTNNSEITYLDIPYTGSVTSIGDYAFAGGTSFVNVTLRNNLTSIGQFAFKDCTGLTSVTIPISVTSVSNYAFNGCTGLVSVTINSDDVASATYSYYWSSSSTSYDNFRSRFGNQVTSYTFGPEVTAIGKYALYDCTGVTQVTLGNNLTSISDYAFFSCSGLTSVTIPSSVTSVGNYAFSGCTDLTSVTINSNEVASANYNYVSFSYNNYENFRSRFGNQVTSYTFGPNVTAIGKYALYGCSGMTQVTFLGPISSIENFAFSDCTGLTQVNITDLAAWCGVNFNYASHSPLYYAQQIYHNGSLLTELTIPSSVSSVGNYAFNGCTDLTSVTINSNAVASATYTDNDNLKTRFGNQVTSYTFGPDVTAIGKYALYGCNGVTEMYVKALIPPTITSTTFGNVSRSIPVYVPVGCAAAYRQAQYWSEFTNFVETIFPGQEVVVPYEQTFDANTIPENWKSYNGQLVGSSSPYTAMLTPESGRWHFGEANGVFNGSSHAFVNIGHYLHSFWLMSPLVHLDANANVLSFDLALTRPTGNMVPIDPDAQDNTRIIVLISNNYGETWTTLQAWKHEMGYTDIIGIQPDGDTHYYNLTNYANQNVLIGFYMECTDADDASNRIHIDNFSIASFDPTLPPVSVTVSQVGSHSAKVSWTAASPVQYEWDVAVAPQWITTSNEMEGYANTIMTHVSGYSYTTMTGLASANSYHAWVRYNNGTTTSAWTRTIDYFTTAEVCGHPTITNVEASPTTLFVTWEPGESDQTSFTVYVSGSDYPSEFDFENVTSALIDVSNFIEPEENYTVQVGTICSDNGDEIFSDYWTGTMAPWPTLTMNDGTNTSYTAVINAYETSEGYASTQFVVPASQLEDMQYSYIEKLQFYCSNVQNGQPWGSNASFEVRMAVVDFDDYSGICGDDFFPWSSMSLFYDGSLSITNGVMTLIPNYSYSGSHFRYEGGSLLIGIKQTEDGTSSQASWYGVNTPAAMSGHIVYQDNPDIVVCDYFAPKVTFGYAQDAYLPPTDIVVEPIGNYEVYVSWTMRDGSTAVDFEISDDNFTNDVWGYEDIEDGYFIYDDVWPEDNFQVRLRSVFVVNGVTIRSAWSQLVSFTMPEACESPYNLAADNIGPFSATLAWEGDAEVYEVEYREVLSEGFENGVPEGWTSLKGTETSNGWYRTGMYHSGDYSLVSICHSTNHGDDWLISPQVELGGVLSFWKNCSGPNTNFSIYVSTTGTNIEDLELVASGTATASSSWSKFNKDLSNYSGLGYIAIRHNDNLSTPRTLYIDDLLYGYPSWTTLDATTENSIEVSDLTPGKSYHFQVRGTCDTGFTSDWSSAFVFTTESNIVFEDPIVKAACVYAWDANGNGDGELSYAEAAAVTDITNVFNGDPTITSFNELQYFTGLTEIGDHAFAGCTNLAQITLPPQITNIDDYAFGSCSSLQSITIPNGVDTIDNYAFSESGLTYVGLPNTLMQIGMLAFGNCNNLTAVYLPATVTNIDGNAFTGASIESIAVAVDNPNYDSRGGCNAIIETATNKLITGCKNTIVPDDITTIGISAFENCSNLTEITLPTSLETIGEYAFLNCYGLTTINAAGETPPDIYGNTFMNLNPDDITVVVPCGTLLDYRNANYWEYFNFVDPCNIVFADANVKAVCVANWDTSGDGELSYAEATAVTNLGTVFRGNTTITSFNELVYFTGLQALAANAFNGCTHLTSVMLPNSIIATGNNSFKDCSSLVSVTLSESLRRIVNYTFQNCSALTHIDFPSTVTYIGASFDGCSNLSSIVIPASVNTIIDGAFNNCHSLQSIVVESGNTVYDSRNGCNAIIKTETNELVVGCDNTVIPDGVVTIGQSAFYGRHQMTTITLPASVTSIGNQAFYSCRGLTEMYVKSSTPPTLGTNVFNGSPTGVSNTIPVYVPCEAIETYQATTGWNNFTNFQANPEFICFADPDVKAICVAHWDTNGDGELSYAEAAAVMSLGQTFRYKPEMDTFDELQYFTGLISIDDFAFAENHNLVSIILPEDITSIGARAFAWSDALPSITIPNSVTILTHEAFRFCAGLTEVTLGTGLTYIDEVVFHGCDNLTTINALSETPPTLFDNYVFAGVPLENITVNVPCGSLETYQNASGWNAFSNIVDPCAGAVQTIALASGVNWVSFYVETDLDALKAALVAAMPVSGVTIAAKDDGQTFYNGTRWRGALASLDMAQMYRITVPAACEIVVEGMPVDPSSHPITIKSGLNWIAYPFMESMTITDAFAGFAVSGDEVRAKDDGIAKYVGTRWRGALTNLVPGQGYIYNSAVSGNRTFTFPTSSGKGRRQEH